VLLGPTDAAKAYPGLFPSAESARKALDRELQGRYFPDIPLRVLIHRGMSGKYLAQVSYRPAGRGQQARQAWAAPGRLPRLREWLEGLLGPLAHYAVAEAAPSEAAHPSPPATPEPFPAQQCAAEAEDDWQSEYESDEALGLGAGPDPSPGGPWCWEVDRAPMRCGDALGAPFSAPSPELNVHPAAMQPHVGISS
jgi:hypothetical protein